MLLPVLEILQIRSPFVEMLLLCCTNNIALVFQYVFHFVQSQWLMIDTAPFRWWLYVMLLEGSGRDQGSCLANV